MAKKYVKSVEQFKSHEDELRLVNDGLPTSLEHSWTAMIKTWENDRSAPNPYYTPVTSTQVYISIVVSLTFGCRSLRNRDRQCLTLEEEEEQMRLGKIGPEHYTRTKFLLYGLDVEHSQYVLYILSS